MKAKKKKKQGRKSFLPKLLKESTLFPLSAEAT